MYEIHNDFVLNFNNYEISIQYPRSIINYFVLIDLI